jgi:ABC-type Mn2+/Zn2+ transport system ATPase subunit
VSDTPILELRGVAVGYDRRALLRDLDFRIARGSFTGLLGANGSGKTTVLKTIAGILPPVAGQVTFHPPATLGYVPQRDQLDSIFIFSALEVALMGVCGRIGAGRRIPRAERDHVRDCLRQTGAESFARQRFSELSGGQKQRVLIARALASRADFLILDEPTAGVDAAATNAIIDLLVRLNREKHLTIVMVNHDFAAVRRSADRVIWLHQGTVLQGSVGELLQRDRIEELLQLQFN